MDRHARVSAWLNDVKAHLTLKVTFFSMICSGIICGVYVSIYALLAVSFLNDDQEKRHEDKSEKLIQIVHIAEISLSLAEKDAASEGAIFAQAMKYLQSNLEKHNVTYNLALIDSAHHEKKFSKAGWVQIPPSEHQLVDHINDPDGEKIIIYGDENLAITNKNTLYKQPSALILTISKHSLSQALQVAKLDFIIGTTDKLDLNPDSENGMAAHIYPLNESISLRYWEPEISFSQELQKFFFSFRNLLIITFFFLAGLIATMYVFFVNRIENGYRQKLKRQEKDLLAITDQLNSADAALNEILDGASAASRQKIAIDVLLSKIENYKGQDGKISTKCNKQPVDLERIELLPLIDTVLNCFEVQRATNKLNVHVRAPDRLLLINGNYVAITGIFYNLFNRSFCRSLPNGSIAIEIIEDANKVTMNLVDEGYYVGVDHSSYFCTIPGLSVLMRKWDKLLELAKTAKASISCENINKHKTCVKLEIEIYSDSSTDRKKSNVVPLFN